MGVFELLLESRALGAGLMGLIAWPGGSRSGGRGIDAEKTWRFVFLGDSNQNAVDHVLTGRF